MNHANIFLYRNKIKKDFIQEHGLTPAFPVLEVLLVADAVLKENLFFTVKMVHKILVENSVQQSNPHLYGAINYLKGNGYIDFYNQKMRQWYQPQRYFFTSKGGTLLHKFKDYVER